MAQGWTVVCFMMFCIQLVGLWWLLGSMRGGNLIEDKKLNIYTV